MIRRTHWLALRPGLEPLEVRLALSYSVAQIRAAYGLNSIPAFGSATADGSGQTIAIVDAYNDPSILSDLDGFDKAMSVSSSASQTLYQQYGAASSLLTVFNQTGTDITSQISNSGKGAVPPVDSTGGWETEETLDVEWAHAIAPGAHIDLIECNDPNDGLFAGVVTAAGLPGVTVLSMSWGEYEFSDEASYDTTTFVTPNGHDGVTFLASSGDGGVPAGYPAFSPDVVSVGATQLNLSNNAYGSETAWNLPSPRALDNGGGSYTETGSWTSQSGGFGGTYATAAAGSGSSATWTTSISSSDKGWSDGTDVSATWVAGASNATDATYSIYDGTAATGTLLGTVTVDQTQAPVGITNGGAKFQYLGNFFPTSGTLTVVLSADSADGTVVADAIGITPAWAGGGGESQVEPEPSYQLSVQNSGFRMTPDVSFDGSSNSGVTIYLNGQLAYGYAGTSLSSPCWAGLIAIADQGRVAYGGTPLNSTANPEQTLQALYSLPADDFHDITSGYNGLSAGPGYDEDTGLGSPIANLLVPALAAYELPARLVVTVQPELSVTAGSGFGLTVEVEDDSGDVISGYSGTVTITLNGAGTLDGTLTVNVVDGVATFTDLVLDVAGTGDTLTASGDGLAAATTDTFTVTPDTAYQMVIATQPSATATAGVPFATEPVIKVEDRFGNVETSDNATQVTVSLNSGTGPLQGTLSVTVANGVATFTDLADDLAETISLLFTSGALPTVTSNAIVIAPGALSLLVIHLQPSPTATAGRAFAVQPVIDEEDLYHNRLTGDDSTIVTVSLASGAGPLQGTTQVTVSGGVAMFTDLGDNVAGTITLSFHVSAPGVSAVVSDSVTISPAAASRLVFTQQPSDVNAGTAITPAVTVQVEDPYGNLITTDNSTVTLTLNNGSFEGGAGTATTNADGGVATFGGLKIDTAGNDTIAATDGSLTATGPSDTFVVSPAAVSTLILQTQPSATATAGQAFAVQPVIVEEDQYHNRLTGDNSTIVTASLASGDGSLKGTTQAIVSGGAVTFTNLADNIAGTITLSFGISTPGVSTVVSNSVTIHAAAASQLVFTQQPGNTVAGTAVAPAVTVEVQDPYGNLITSNASTVTLTLDHGTFEGGASTATAQAVGGVATFGGLKIDTAGSDTVAASDGSLTAMGPSESFTVSPAAVSQLILQAQPSLFVTAGQTFGTPPVVVEEDPYGNTETGDSGTVVTVSLASGTGPLNGTSQVKVSGGVATFSGLTDDIAGTITLSFGISVPDVSPVVSNSVTISPAAASQLVFTQQPSNTVAGTAIAPAVVVKVEDTYGNVVTNDGSTVTLTLISGGFASGLTTATAAAVSGVATFAGLTIDTAGSYALIASDGVLPASQSAGRFIVTPAAATHLVIETQPSATATAGQPFTTQPVIREEDAFGNIETADDGTVITAAIATGAGPLLGPTMATVSGGVATFTGLFSDTAGTVALAFSATGLTGIGSSTIVIAPAAASQLAISLEPPATVAAGVGFGVDVTVEDPFANVVPIDTGSVTISLAGGPGGTALGGPFSASIVNGVATFAGLTLDVPASGYTLQAASTGLTSATSNAFSVVPGAPTRLVILTQPQATITAGSGFGVVVEAEDAFGDVVTSFDGDVTIAMANNPGGGSLGGTLTVAAAHGMATFSGLVLDRAATGYRLDATGGGLPGVTTAAFAVIPAAATQLVVTSQPPSSQSSGSPFSVVVAAEDPYGNIDATHTGDVTVSLPSGSSGRLGGTTTATLVNGIATFSGLTLEGTGGYALGVSGGGLVSAVSSAIEVTPPPTIVGEQILTAGKRKRKHTVGFELLFSAALDPARARNAANYTVTEAIKHGRKSSVRAVAIRAVYDAAAKSVSLTIVGKAPFPRGGQLIVNAASPGGITDASGTPLDGNDQGVPGDKGVFVILPKARGMVR